MIRHNLHEIVAIGDLRRKSLLYAMVIFFVVIMSGTIAFLIAHGYWRIALILIIFLPIVVILHKYPTTSLVIWLLVAPFLVNAQTAANRQMFWIVHRALPPLTIGLVILGGVLQLRKDKKPKFNLIEISLLGYIGVSLLSIFLLNRDPLATFYQFYDRVIIPMFLYLIVRLFFDFERDSKWLIPVSFFVVLTQLVVGLLALFAPAILPQQWIDSAGRIVGTLETESVYSTTLIFFGTLLLHEGIRKSKLSIRLLYLSVFFLAGFGTFISFSRASWLGAAIVILGLIFLYPKRMLLMLLIVFPLVAFLGVGFLSEQFRFANERLNSRETALDRLPIYYAAVRMFESKPMTGWGYGNFDIFDRDFQGRVADVVNPEKDHASHNLYLTLLAEQGIIGVSLYLIPVFLWLFHASKFARRTPNNSIVGRGLIFILCLTLFNHIIVNMFSNMRVPFGLGIWWIALALIANIVSESTSKTFLLRSFET